MSNDSEPKRRVPVLSVLAILIAVGWLAAGALYKLFAGSPNDLPQMIKEEAQLRLGWDMVETFRAVITVELIVVTLALLRPRIGWLVLAGQYAVFVTVLLWMQALGAEKCGCFGSKINIKPHEMLFIDVPILLLLLASRPWRIRTKFNPVVWGVVVALAGVAWWLPHREFKTLEDILPTNGGEVADGNGGVTEVGGDGQETPNGGGEAADSNPLADVDFVELKPNGWADQIVYDIDLATFMVNGPDDLPFPAHVILYRKSCEHCRDHLNELALAPPATDKGLVLVLIPEDPSMPDVIENLPAEHVHKQLWPTKRGYGLATPWTFDIDDFAMVTNVVNLRDE